MRIRTLLLALPLSLMLSAYALAAPDAPAGDVVVRSGAALQAGVGKLPYSAEDAPRIQKTKPTYGLDIHDEPPVGDNGYMRGKKNNYMRPIVTHPSNDMWNLFIAIDLVLLAALGIFVIAYSNRVPKPR